VVGLAVNIGAGLRHLKLPDFFQAAARLGGHSLTAGGVAESADDAAALARRTR
jgi:hypothetical protein